MKLVTINRDGRDVPGALLGADILDFALAAPLLGNQPVPGSVAEILDESTQMMAAARSMVDAAASAAARLRAARALVPAAEVRLRAPLPHPTTIFSHGLAYHSHARDWDSDAKPVKPANPPAGFLKALSAISDPGGEIRIPRMAPDMIDFEGEFCVVFGRECHGVLRDEAMNYVAGYTIINDVSARNWAKVLTDPNAPRTPAYAALNIIYKNFPTFCPMGPNVTTKEEIADVRTLRLVTRLNGQEMQDASISDLIWDIPELIESYSAVFRFLPGDVMSTGTPGGVGMGRKPPVFMKDGDVVEVEVKGVGVLTSRVVGPE